MKPKGFVVIGGYMGLMPDGRYHLFATEEDYLEVIREEQDDNRGKKNTNKENKDARRK